ncbi:MAG: DUF1573 domain-containing protein [Planctomycetota bacterium]
MRPTVLVILCLASLLALAGFARAQAPAPTGPMPPIRLDPPEFDAGRIDPEDLINATFRVINTSNRTMVIDAFTTSCKCTAPVINQREIPPGGDVEVTATVDVRGSYGDVSKSFTLKFRGYERQVACVMKAHMQHAVACEPVRLRSMSGVVRLTSSDGRPFAPVAIHNEGARYRFLAVRPQGRERAVVWDVQYALPAGSSDSNLLIETDHARAPLVTPRMFTSHASRPEVTYIKQRHEIYSVRTHANLGTLPVGGTFDLACQLKRSTHDTGIKVFTGIDGIDAEVVSVEPIPGEDDTKMYTIRLTNTGAEPGGVLTPLYFETPDFNEETGENFRARVWVMALVPEPVDEAMAPTDASETGGE